MASSRRKKKKTPLEEDALWYKDAVIYQTHVRAFHDSDADGIGDFAGLTEKLPYLQDLGITALWILPFYPSPLKDDGYDIANYTDVNPSYGTIADFKKFVREAHRLGIRVITELVINHTSDQHPWFQKARSSPPESKAREFYVWSDTPEKYADTRIIFKDFESSNWSWDPVAKQYYWHRFYHHQPDLNFDNPAVHRALFKALDFWMNMGVDGLRLDAIPYLYEREGTNCENLPETHEYLKKLRAHVDASFDNRMLLAEANQWPEDSRQYFGDGDECHMSFHFPLMPRLYQSIAIEDRFPIIDIINQTPAIPDNCQWAVFLRNHDELTLEMVTDEDRDFMWRMYAKDSRARINLGIRRRLAPLLGNHRRRIELLNGLLFSFPGTPIIYYGDEIGMGDNIYLGDRNGVRTPMQWSSDRNAGFSRANPQKLYFPVIVDPEYHYETVNVEAQQGNPSSLLWWMKRLIALRKQYRAFGRGSMDFLHPQNSKILAFTRSWEDETILVVANLSRFVQYAELDLSRHRGMIPREMFGQAEFPRIGESPFIVTLGPHEFYWFSLEPSADQPALLTRPDELPLIRSESLDDIFSGRSRSQLGRAIQQWLPGRRWFAGKSRKIKTAEISEWIPMIGNEGGIAFVLVEYVDGGNESYLLPLAAGAQRDGDDPRLAPIAKLKTQDEELWVHEAIWNRRFIEALIQPLRSRKSWKGSRGHLQGEVTPVFRELGREGLDLQYFTISRAEQSNTSVIFEEKLIVKLFRKLESGVSPDLEIHRFLTRETGFRHIAPLAGAIEYEQKNQEPVTIGIAQRFIPNMGDAWSYALGSINRYYERVLGDRTLVPSLEAMTPSAAPLQLAGEIPPEIARDQIGDLLWAAEMIGRRTAEMHLALGSNTEQAAFAPEPFSTHYQQSLYQQLRRQTIAAIETLKGAIATLSEEHQRLAGSVIDAQETIQSRIKAVLDKRIDARRTRIHGDYHLGQLLFTGDDFVIIDFEGEPARALTERRIKRSPLRDVAGMMRSFHYAPYSVLLGPGGPPAQERSEELEILSRAARFWYRWTEATFLGSYLETMSGGNLLPRDGRELGTLLDVYLLEKAMYEAVYELNNRPDWIGIPLRGVLDLL
jgi:maltose alpha-D-glucosyltransferase / alpha-amylase